MTEPRYRVPKMAIARAKRLVELAAQHQDVLSDLREDLTYLLEQGAPGEAGMVISQCIASGYDPLTEQIMPGAVDKLLQQGEAKLQRAQPCPSPIAQPKADVPIRAADLSNRAPKPAPKPDPEPAPKPAPASSHVAPLRAVARPSVPDPVGRDLRPGSGRGVSADDIRTRLREVPPVTAGLFVRKEMVGPRPDAPPGTGPKASDIDPTPILSRLDLARDCARRSHEDPDMSVMQGILHHAAKVFDMTIDEVISPPSNLGGARRVCLWAATNAMVAPPIIAKAFGVSVRQVTMDAARVEELIAQKGGQYAQQCASVDREAQRLAVLMFEDDALAGGAA